MLQAATSRGWYKKTPGCVTLKGQMYEIKLAALIFARASNRGVNFFLATNVDGAGSFDDILFRYQLENTWRNAFIQMKNKPNVHLNLNRFLGKRGHFALKLYCNSFSAIKEKLDQDSDNELFKGSIENCDFVIFTTAELDNVLQKRERKCTSGPIEQLLETKSKSIFSFCKNVDNDVYEALSRYNLDSMRDFLKSLKVFSKQPKEEELDIYLVEEIRTKFKVSKMKARQICVCYVDEFKNWWSNRRSILDETSEILNNSFNQYKVSALTIEEVDKFCKDVTFQNTAELDRLMCQDTPFLNVIPYVDNAMDQTCNKLLQVVDEKYEMYIFVSIGSLLRNDNKHAVISEWRWGKSDLLVIVCERDLYDAALSEDICNLLSETKMHKKKCITLSYPGNTFVESLRKGLGEDFCSQIQDTFDMEHDENEN